MRKVIEVSARRPVIVAGLVLVGAVLQGWSSWRPLNSAGLVISLVLVIAAAGLLMRRPWAAWLVVGQAVLVFALAIWIAGALIVRGWVYPDLAGNVFSLIPIAVWLLTWIGLALAVRGRLRQSRDPTRDFVG